MPSYRHHDHGNLYIQFDVKFPSDHFNTPEKIALLEDILPPRNVPEIPIDAMVDDVALEEVDQSQQARVNASAQGMDDEDEGHPGGERVQCASQ